MKTERVSKCILDIITSADVRESLVFELRLHLKRNPQWQLI